MQRSAPLLRRGALLIRAYVDACRAIGLGSAERHKNAAPRPGHEVNNYADAVVTPPSTTMVWPVMKVDASEAR